MRSLSSFLQNWRNRCDGSLCQVWWNCYLKLSLCCDGEFPCQDPTGSLRFPFGWVNGEWKAMSGLLDKANDLRWLNSLTEFQILSYFSSLHVWKNAIVRRNYSVEYVEHSRMCIGSGNETCVSSLGWRCWMTSLVRSSVFVFMLLSSSFSFVHVEVFSYPIPFEHKKCLSEICGFSWLVFEGGILRDNRVTSCQTWRSSEIQSIFPPMCSFDVLRPVCPIVFDPHCEDIESISGSLVHLIWSWRCGTLKESHKDHQSTQPQDARTDFWGPCQHLLDLVSCPIELKLNCPSTSCSLSPPSCRFGYMTPWWWGSHIRTGIRKKFMHGWPREYKVQTARPNQDAEEFVYTLNVYKLQLHPLQCICTQQEAPKGDCRTILQPNVKPMADKVNGRSTCRASMFLVEEMSGGKGRGLWWTASVKLRSCTDASFGWDLRSGGANCGTWSFHLNLCTRN